MDDDWNIKNELEYLSGTIVPKKLLPQIGAIAVYFSHVDHALNNAIGAMLGLNEQQRSIFMDTIQSFSSRVELFKTLGLQKHVAKKKRARITEIAQHLRFAGDDRNRLMHDEIFESTVARDSARITTARLAGITRKHQSHQFDLPVMIDLQKRLIGLQWCLFDLARDDRGWLNAPLPSLDISPTLRLRRENEARQRKPDKRRRRPKS